MSVPNIPPSGPPAPPPLPPQPPQRLGGCLTAFLVLTGIALLLPGICSLIFIGMSSGGKTGEVAVLWGICLLISAAGIALIWVAARNR